MTTYRTQADLVTQILIELAVVPEGMTPEADDFARVEDNVPSLIEQLAATETIYVPDTGNIPNAWFLPLATVMAYELRNMFGATGDAAATLETANANAIVKLKVMSRGRPTYEPLKTVSF